MKANAKYWLVDAGSNAWIQLRFSKYKEYLNWLLAHYFLDSVGRIKFFQGKYIEPLTGQECAFQYVAQSWQNDVLECPTIAPS